MCQYLHDRQSREAQEHLKMWLKNASLEEVLEYWKSWGWMGGADGRPQASARRTVGSSRRSRWSSRRVQKRKAARAQWPRSCCCRKQVGSRSSCRSRRWSRIMKKKKCCGLGSAAESKTVAAPLPPRRYEFVPNCDGTAIEWNDVQTVDWGRTRQGGAPHHLWSQRQWRSMSSSSSCRNV